MKERVLITGASGFVGYHLVEAALQAELEVHAAIRPGSAVGHLQPFDLRYTCLDYTRPEALVEELQRQQYQYIIHAAGITKARSAQEYNQVNAGFTRNLAAAVLQAGIPLKKFVFVSSLAALGPTCYQDPQAIAENRQPAPLTAYGRSKLLAESYLAGLPQLPWVVLRPTAVYGPRERDIFLVLETLHRGLDPYIGRQPQWLSFVYVQDLAQAALLALAAPGQQLSYNLSDGQRYDRYALADITRRVLGKKALRFHLPLGLVQVVARLLEATYAGKKMPALNREKLLELTAANWHCSIVRARQDLGFVPRYDLEKGLALTLAWYRQQQWLRD
jgi:nucleoside-diphosphate-sugar epimerase